MTCLFFSFTCMVSPKVLLIVLCLFISTEVQAASVQGAVRLCGLLQKRPLQ